MPYAERAVSERRCWCGHADLEAFSPGYWRCGACETLVWGQAPDPGIARVGSDEAGFYGRDYWFDHQQRSFGYPTIETRVRTDLPERSLYWLRALLKHKLPPARVLEIGSGPGAFVAMLTAAGFDATGLEISPWVVQFVRETFRVPMLAGPVEDQDIAPGSLDAIALMDVLEHLADPAATMRHCLALLKPDGVLLVQTPRYPEGARHEALEAAGDRFLESLKPTDHLYLFSRRSIQEFFARLGVEHVCFEPALFAEYDMFLAASRAPLAASSPEAIDRALEMSPSGRLVRALLDLDDQRAALARRYVDSEADRAARLDAIASQGRRLGSVEAERNDLRADADTLRAELARSEADRAARLAVIQAQGGQLGAMEGERNAALAETRMLRDQLAVSEADRAARLEVIHAQGHRLGEVDAEANRMRAELESLRRSLGESEADRAARLGVIEQLARRIDALEAERDVNAEAGDLRDRLEHSERDRAARLEVIEEQGRRLGAVEAERNALSAEVEALRGHLAHSESDRAARLEVIEAQGRRLAEVEAEQRALQSEVEALRARLGEREASSHEEVSRRVRAMEAEHAARLADLAARERHLGADASAKDAALAAAAANLDRARRLIEGVERTRAYRVLRRFGRWTWFERARAAVEPGTNGHRGPHASPADATGRDDRSRS